MWAAVMFLLITADSDLIDYNRIIGTRSMETVLQTSDSHLKSVHFLNVLSLPDSCETNSSSF